MTDKMTHLHEYDCGWAFWTAFGDLCPTSRATDILGKFVGGQGARLALQTKPIADSGSLKETSRMYFRWDTNHE